MPSELRAELARASSIAENAWVEAKARSDFAMLLPHLERIVELTRRFAECYDGFPGFSRTYDALLDEYEPEMTTEQMRDVLADLREGLVPLVAEATRNGGRPEERPVPRRVPRRRSARAGQAGDRGAALPGGLVAARSDRASLRALDRDDRRPPDHAIRREQPRDGPVQRDARVGSRPLRGGRRSRARRHAARERALPGPARVPEPPLGELGGPGRSLARAASARVCASVSPTPSMGSTRPASSGPQTRSSAR